MIGKTLAHYEITSLLGKGGMGEVYQAKDLKLGRDVAIKVLPDEFAKDADRVARFQREAKLLASLNHSNIASIYGLEESGKTNFLVLELVEGETLADRIKAGPIPVEESLKLALQIAEALEAAHEKSVIHRDLKPANIKVTPDGKVKVLDFGLAKAFAGEQAEIDLSNSPTLSNAATQHGLILGTAAYMSPEQASGKTVDRRADVWAFGVVLYEMLTGRSLFAGENVSQTLARVLERQPDFSSLPPNLHPKIVEMLERCLEKDARNRYNGIGDARVDVRKVLADPGGVGAKPAAGAGRGGQWRPALPWAAAAVVLGAMIAGVAVWKLRPPEPRPVIRLDEDLPEGLEFNTSAILPCLTVSPDGKQLVYATSAGLYLRSTDSFAAKHIAGTEGSLQQPLFSPDGKWVAYFSATDQKLKKIGVDGGAPVTLCSVTQIVGASWSAEDTIVYIDRAGIGRISANGGPPEMLVPSKGENLFHPRLMPGGKSVMFTLATKEGYRTAVQSLETGERKVLFAGDCASYLPTGHIVFAVGNTLSVVPFDPHKLEAQGRPAPVVEGVFRVLDLTAPQFAVSASGTMAYLPGTTLAGAPTRATGRTLVWVDRKGEEELAAPPNFYAFPRISPDGTRVALTIGGGTNLNLWIWDLVRKNLTRLTFDEAIDFFPLWTPDGKRLSFASVRGGEAGLYWKAADGTGDVESILDLPHNHVAFSASWSGDGKTLVFWEGTGSIGSQTMGAVLAGQIQSPGVQFIMPPDIRFGLGMLSMEGDRAPKPLLKEQKSEKGPQISPDGRWLAYSSSESGHGELYVRPFPNVDGGKWQVSAGGGQEARWSPDGRELFYLNGDAMMAVPIETEPAFKAGAPEMLFRKPNYSSGALGWDISPDGKRFLMMKEPDTTAGGPRKINIVVNWFEELKQRMPVK